MNEENRKSPLGQCIDNMIKINNNNLSPYVSFLYFKDSKEDQIEKDTNNLIQNNILELSNQIQKDLSKTDFIIDNKEKKVKCNKIEIR